MILNIIGWFILLIGWVFAFNDKFNIAVLCFGISCAVFVLNIVLILLK